MPPQRRLHAAMLTAAALASLPPRLAQATVYVDDSLTSGSSPGRGSKGGIFGANGWTTTNAPTDASQDSVWYEIPDALVSGTVAYTVTGLSVGGTLSGFDHDLLAVYQAPTGMPEPIAYMPGFRNNDFKAFTRIFGSQETSRPGAMKLELAFCPRGDPWYHDTACPAGCDQSGLAYANGNQNDVGWDPAASYRMSITWGSGQIAFARDGVTLGTVSYAGAYAPKPLRVRLGSPRNDGIYPGAAFMPAGLTFRDVLVSGDTGTETPACGASAPDAGTGGSGAGGAPAGGADAGATGIELGALEDVTAASWEPAVFSDPNDLNIEAAAEGTPTAVVYLRFPAVTGVIKQAILRLHTQAYVSASGGSGVPCAIADDAWHETTLTWSTRPAVGSACAGAPSTVDPDAEVAWDVTALLAPGGPHYDLALVSHDPDGAHYVSKELGGAVSGPRLHVVLDTASPGTGGASGAGASGSGGASSWGTPAGGAPAGAGRGVHETGSAAASGCATRPGPHGGEAVALCSLLLALTGARRGGWRLKGSDRSRPRRCPSSCGGGPDSTHRRRRAGT